MRTHITIAALLAACVLVAGCGGDEEEPAAAADQKSKNRDAQLEYAQCMREHGVDMPDPTSEGGRQTFKVGPGEETTPEEYEEADKACAKFREAIEPPEMSEQEQQEFKEAALAHARCMREHGVEKFPDPTFGEKGEAQVRIRKGSGIDPDDEDFKEAQEACEDKRPDGPSTTRSEAP